MIGLRAEAVSFGYGGDPVLEEVTLGAPVGAVTAIVGPNGAGKTTLLRLLAGILRPGSGRVLLGSEVLSAAARRRVARRIAFAPQLERPTWPLTVSEMVSLGRLPHRSWLLPFTRRDREVVERALAAADLEPLAGRLVTELSGGEFRRVVLARTLAQEPRVVLMDEPTAHLDLRHQAGVLAQLRALAHERGLTVVMTLHDLNQAAAYADRVALLHAGRVLVDGTPAEALTAVHLTRAYGVEVAVLHDRETGRSWITAAETAVCRPPRAGAATPGPG